MLKKPECIFPSILFLLSLTILCYELRRKTLRLVQPLTKNERCSPSAPLFLHPPPVILIDSSRRSSGGFFVCTDYHCSISQSRSGYNDFCDASHHFFHSTKEQFCCSTRENVYCELTLIFSQQFVFIPGSESCCSGTSGICSAEAI